MPAVTGRIEEANVTEGTGKLHCPHMRENSDDSPQIEEKKEKEIKEQATQLDETGTKENVSQTGTVNLHFLIPGTSEPISATFSLQDNVQDLRQIVLDRPESCYRTCFSLQMDGVRLDDFAELHMVEGLKDDTTIKVVEEPYSVREARIHLRRIKDLLNTNFHLNAYSAVDHLSLSFLSAVAGVDVEEEVVRVKGQNVGTVSTEECLPPAQVFALEEVPSLLEPLFPANAEPKVPQCVKDLSPSAWNPPPGNRRLAGDLLYIDVLTLEDAQVNVTASTCGFFVNRLVFNLGIHEQPISLLLTALVLFVLFEDITCYCALFGSHANIQIISGGIVVVINIICNMQTKLNLLPISQKNVNLTIANKNLSPICN